MSLLLEYIEKHPKETKRLAGINYQQLQQLFTQAEVRHHQKQVEIESAKFRLILFCHSRQKKSRNQGESGK